MSWQNPPRFLVRSASAGRNGSLGGFRFHQTLIPGCHNALACFNRFGVCELKPCRVTAAEVDGVMSFLTKQTNRHVATLADFAVADDRSIGWQLRDLLAETFQRNIDCTGNATSDELAWCAYV